MARRFTIIGMIASVAFILFVAVLWNIFLREVPLRIAEETTYITEPLTTDGKRVDYFRYVEERFYPPEMQTDANGYRVFVRNCGDLVYSDSVLRRQTYAKLGLDPAEVTQRHFQDTPREPIPPEPGWTTSAPVKEWIDEHDDILDHLAEAVRQPVFQIPLVRREEDAILVELLHHHLIFALREFVYGFSRRSDYRRETGDVDGAHRDSVTCILIGRQMARSDPTGHSFHIAASYEGMGLYHPLQNDTYPADAAQLRRFLAELDALPPRPSYEDITERARFYALDTLQLCMHASTADIAAIRFEEYFHTNRPYRWNGIFRRVNAAFDRTLAGNDFTDLMKKDDAPWSWSVQGRSRNFGADIIGMFVPVRENIASIFAEYDCQFNMKRLAVALLLYEKEHGALPDGNWCAAIRPYLGENAKRCFHCPEHTAREGETSYVFVRDGPPLLLELRVPIPCERATVPPLTAADWGSTHVYKNHVVLWNGSVLNVIELEKANKLAEWGME